MSPSIKMRPSNATLLKRATWFAVLVAPFALIALVDYFVDPDARGESIWEIHRADVLASDVADASRLPAEGWQEVVLPNRTTHYGYGQYSAWFRLEVVLASATTELWAVYIPAPNSNYAITVNGKFAAETGSTVPPVPRHLVPVILQFPGALLHSGKNIVDVHITCEIPGLNLREVYVGPYSVLGPVYESATFFLVTVKQVMVVCMLVMSLTMAALYRLRPRDVAFGWYALALLFWALSIAAKLMPLPPFPATHLWVNVPRIAIGGYVICAAFFVNCFVGAKDARVERLGLYWGCFGAVVLIVDPLLFGYRTPWFYERIWLPPILAVGIYGTWQLVRAARDKSNIEARLLAIVSWWALVAGASDVLMSFGLLRFRPQYLAYFVGPVLVAFGFVLLRRFARAADVVARARDELAIRVAEKTVELERNLVHLKGLERKQALSAERERIMRDMHDGVGSQLVQALSMATNRPELQPMERPLRICLEELSLIIDSIEPVNGDLASVLGMLRMRMSHRFDEAGVNVRWEVVEIPVLAEFGPQRVLQVTRIVHEAIANALKHSRAKQITVRAKVGDRDSSGAQVTTVVIEVIDSGFGFLMPNRGSGLGGMQQRAVELGGHLTIESCNTGTTVRFELPLFAATTAELSTVSYD